jgi:hypothetical protein
MAKREMRWIVAGESLESLPVSGAILRQKSQLNSIVRH